MRQLLMLGFYCEVYRREPLCRVYINDVLADEFNIPRCDNKQFEIDMLDPLVYHKHLQHFINNPPFLKVIEFDNADADSLDVVLKIKNDDNNYANGFMNKYTTIMLSNIYLISKNVLENINNIKNDFKFSRKNWEKYNRNIVYFYAYHNRHVMFQNLIHNTTLNFPGITLKPKEYLGSYKIGSSGYFHVIPKKKLGFWNAGKCNSKGIWRVGDEHYVKYLYDKYKQYENQRSIDT